MRTTPRPRPPRRILTREEVEALLAGVDDQLADVIRAMAYEGKRRRDCLPEGWDAVTASRRFKEALQRAGLPGTLTLHHLRHVRAAEVWARRHRMEGRPGGPIDRNFPDDPSSAGGALS